MGEEESNKVTVAIKWRRIKWMGGGKGGNGL